MGLTTLPAEIQNLVFADEGLTRRDYKSLRLTSPRFRAAFNASLFSRVRVSKARKDWDLFMEMTARPELAGFVQELVWYELFDVGDMLERRREETETGSNESEVGTPLLSADDLFCVPEGSHDRSDPAIRPTMVRLQQEFLAAVDRMPRLDSFVSMPMPAEHALATAPRAVRARELYRWLVGDSAPAHKRRQARLCPAQGYEAFLQVAMARTDSPRRLLLVDPPWAFGDGPRSALGCAGASRLVDVTVCTEWRPRQGDSFDMLLACAARLRRLKVCNRAGPRVGVGEPQAMPVGFPGLPERLYAYLETLHLVSVPLGGSGVGLPDEDTEAFVQFLRRHQARLRHVVLDRCSVGRGLVRAIGATPGVDLNLETFRVISVATYGRTPLVEEGALLGILNGEAESLSAVSHVSDCHIFSTFRSAHSEPARVEGNGLDCDATDPGIDVRSDGHLVLHGKREGMDYMRRKRAKGAARWELGQADGGIYAWRSAAPGASQTSRWLFRHRTGAEALGDEPLAHFLEWDSEDGGDYAVDTPLGDEVQAFAGDSGTWRREDEIPERAMRVDSEALGMML